MAAEDSEVTEMQVEGAPWKLDLALKSDRCDGGAGGNLADVTEELEEVPLGLRFVVSLDPIGLPNLAAKRSSLVFLVGSSGCSRWRVSRFHVLPLCMSLTCHKKGDGESQALNDKQMGRRSVRIPFWRSLRTKQQGRADCNRIS